MNTTIIPGSGSFDGRKSQPFRRPDAPQSTERAQPATATTKHTGWTRFASHYATWATAGRLPLSE